MNSLLATSLKVILGVAAIFLAYNLYSIIQDPIDFQKMKKKRYAKVKTRLEQIRDAQKAYRAEYNQFVKDIDKLAAFVDTGKQTIIERKDSSFMYYDEVYQQEMRKDTIITRVLGYQDVKKELFGEDFNSESLIYIPYTDRKHKFMMDAGKLNVNDVVVPVFEAKAPDTLIFEDEYEKYSRYIDEEHTLAVGSMSKPTLSGNWK